MLLFHGQNKLCDTWFPENILAAGIVNPKNHKGTMSDSFIPWRNNHLAITSPSNAGPETHFNYYTELTRLPWLVHTINLCVNRIVFCVTAFSGFPWDGPSLFLNSYCLLHFAYYAPKGLAFLLFLKHTKHNSTSESVQLQWFPQILPPDVYVCHSDFFHVSAQMSTSLRGPPCPSTEWSALPCTPCSLYPFSAFSLALPPSLLSCVHVGTASPARTSALEGNLVLFTAVSTRPQNSMVQTHNIFKIKIIPLVLGGLWCSNIKMPPEFV